MNDSYYLVAPYLLYKHSFLLFRFPHSRFFSFTIHSLLKMGIKEEDLPDHYFPDDHPTRGTGKSSSTIEWTKTKSKKVFYILSIVVVLYIYHRRRYRHHRYDYIGNAARTDGNRETIASRFGSFAQHVTSDSDEKKLEAARFYFNHLL